MANTTEFYTYPTRTLTHQNGDPIHNPLVPGASSGLPPVETVNAILVDFLQEVEVSHIFLDHKNIKEIEVIINPVGANGERDISSSTDLLQTTAVSVTPNIYELDQKTSGRFFQLIPSPDPITSETPELNSLLLFNQLLSFKDGAFNQIAFKPTYPTRGHHKMLNGGRRPYHGLGIEKRKMTLGATEVPYSISYNSIADYDVGDVVYYDNNYWRYTVDVSPGTIPTTSNAVNDEIIRKLAKYNPDTDYDVGDVVYYDEDGKNWQYTADVSPGTIPTTSNARELKTELVYPINGSPYYELADLTKINRMFRNNLEFVFVDNLDEYPDRIFPASFEEKELNEPFTNGLKHLGYDVSFTVVEI